MMRLQIVFHVFFKKKSKVNTLLYFLSVDASTFIQCKRNFNGFHKSDDVCILISYQMLTIVVTGTKQYN